MPINRFYDFDLNEHDHEGQLVGDEFNHATKVFRLKINDKLEIINGRGLLAEGVIIEVSKKDLRYKVLIKHQEPNKVPSYALIVGMPKFNRLEFIAEKVTELGCDQLILFNADRSEKLDLSKNQLERLNGIFIASLKQSGRLFLPHVSVKPHLEACFESDRFYFYGDLDAAPDQSFKKHSLMGIIVGPESGFSETEKNLLKHKATGVLLSDATLRVDTAAIVSIFFLKSL